MFNDCYILIFKLAVIKFNFIAGPLYIIADLFETCLDPFAYDIKCIADSHLYFFAFRSVAYLIFSKKLELPIQIWLINPYNSFREWFPKTFCFRVFHFKDNLDLITFRAVKNK